MTSVLHHRRILTWALAPAFWLERARGRRRLALAGLYLLIAATAGVFIWRAARLYGLPDAPPPFDPGPLLALKVPDSENAFILFQQAGQKLKRAHDIEVKILTWPYAWPKGDARSIAYLNGNAEALALWRKGAERPDGLYFPIGDISFETRFPVVQDQRQFARLALVEADRLEAAGDMAGAWGWYRTTLRSGRIVGRHGVIICRLVDLACYALVQRRVAIWAADPRVGCPLLRRALNDVVAINAMTPPDSESLQIEYLSAMRELKDARGLMKFLLEEPSIHEVDKKAWYNHMPVLQEARLFVSNEPERSRRIFNLIFANWLGQCDKPPRLRPPLVGTAKTPAMLYDATEPGPAPSPTALAEFVEGSFFVDTILPSYANFQRAMDRDRAQRIRMVVMLAAQTFRGERGKLPSKASDLIGPYLPRMPENCDPGEIETILESLTASEAIRSTTTRKAP